MYSIGLWSVRNSIFLGMFHFLDTCGHFFFRTAVDNHSAFGAQAAGCADGVHSRVTATDNGYAFTERHRRIGVLAGGVHQVDARQVFVGR